MAPTKVVCDAGPLIHLDEMDSLDLLADFEAVMVPEVAWAEVQHHRPTALERPDLSLQRVKVGRPDVQLEILVQADLDAKLMSDGGEVYVTGFEETVEVSSPEELTPLTARMTEVASRAHTCGKKLRVQVKIDVQ